MEKNFVSFIDKNWDRRRPLVLALSGGPDSLSLYHLLLENHIPFEVAHVNHGWRKESQEEAFLLRKMSQVPFHEKVLSPPTEKRNLEDKARKERLNFFKEVVERIGAQAAVLGHHGDDQAETVLKRVFEGAGLCQLKGLSYVSNYKGLNIWRPLLNVRKQEILLWLENKKISSFYDATNDEKTFLRGRLRQDIFPYLSQNFGKEVIPSLLRLSKLSSELSEFAEVLIKPYFENITDDSLDFSNREPKSQFEWKVVLHAFFERMNMALSMSVVETIIEHLKKGKSCKEMIIKDKKLRIQKKTLKLTKR